VRVDKLGHDCRRVRSHRRRDSTRQLSRVGVGGVYWVTGRAYDSPWRVYVRGGALVRTPTQAQRKALYLGQSESMEDKII